VSHTKKVLWVGSEETCNRRWKLEPCCYEVTRAGTLAEGVRLARNSYFDIYLVNQCGFEGAGITFCRQVRAFNSYTPVLLCSKLAGESQRDETIGSGPLGYFASSAESWEVEQAIVRVLCKAQATKQDKQKVAKVFQSSAGQAAQASFTLKIA
jgi:DNA-binding NarL/FixJ family response regulator